MNKSIASIYFAGVEASRPLYGFYCKIPPVAHGEKPFVLNIAECIQRSQEPGPDGKSKILRRDMVTPREIAEDVMREWTRETVGMTPDCGPGIWIVRDEVPELNADGTPVVDADKRPIWRAATDAEKMAMWDEDIATAKRRDANWAQYLITAGDRLAEDPKQRVLIGPLNKLAARAYGRDREWLEELKDSDTKVCPFCTKRIAAKALKCPNCNEIVDPTGYAAQKARADEATAAAAKGVVRPPVTKSAA